MIAFRLNQEMYFEVPSRKIVDVFMLNRGEIVLRLTEEPIQLSRNVFWWTHIFLTSQGIAYRTSYREELLLDMDLM